MVRLGLRRKWRNAANAVRRALGVGDHWRWMSPAELPDEIPIRPLVYPLRYDILVRKSFFDFYAERRELCRRDFPAFEREARKHAYFTWFEKVLVARFAPDLAGDERAVLDLYRQRIRESAALHDAIVEHGFDPDHPIVPFAGREVLPTDTGILLDTRFYMGDGCHRLSCLMSLGYEALPRRLVRVKQFRRLAPLDNTHLLRPHLPIDWPPGYGDS